VLAGVLFGVFGGEYPNRHFFSRGVMTQGGESMKQNEKCQSLAGYLSGHSEGDKDSPFPQGFVVSKNEDSHYDKKRTPQFRVHQKRHHTISAGSGVRWNASSRLGEASPKRRG
jgi:hypothetical protein